MLIKHLLHELKYSKVSLSALSRYPYVKHTRVCMR